jgi:hypothetical protein
MAIAIFASLSLSDFIPSVLAKDKMFSDLVEQSKWLAPWVFSALSLGAFLWSVCQTFKLWRWNQGEGEFCHSCGGMVVRKEGRYGPYFKCLACNTNRKIL